MSSRLLQFCKRLEMPEEVTDRLLEEENLLGLESTEFAMDFPEKVVEVLWNFPHDSSTGEEEKPGETKKNTDGQAHPLAEAISALADPEKWQSARLFLKQELADRPGGDGDGMKMLCCMLRAMEIAHQSYTRRNISEEIFLETMKCFPRFVREHYDSFGCYGFDRDFWTGRQLSLLLFRLGALEFERVPEEQVISVHIPSDARILPENCEDAWRRAEVFLENYYPEEASWPYVCDSWLLSPALKELLSPRSNILRFQEQFEIQEWDRESEEFMEWVFKRKDIPLEELPENSSLQRKMKEYLLQGGKVGTARGVKKSS